MGSVCYWLLCNTHFDAFNDGNKVKQAERVGNWLSDKVIPSLGVPIGQVRMLLTGDLNIAYQRTALYEKLVAEFSNAGLVPEDLFAALNVSDVKNVKSYDGDSNNLVTHPQNSGRLDYIWSFKGFDSNPVKCSSIEILKQDRGQELSDHYPIIATLQ